MPIYEYRCENGHEFEVLQAMSDDPVTACEQCGASVERVFHPVAVHFKGSGFYTTDYAKKGKAGAAAKDGDSGSSPGEGKSEGKSDSGSGTEGGSSSGSGGSGSGAGKSGSKSDSGSTSATKAASSD
jgi:putative FmdB family regulatory protein